MRRFVVVGGGVAGTRAAETARSRDSEAEIIVLSSENHPFYRRPQLRDYAAGRLTDRALQARTSSFWEERRIDLRLGVKVVSIDPEGKCLAAEHGDKLEFDGLVLATGRTAHKARIPGGDLPGVISFTTLDEAHSLRSLQGRHCNIVVFGDSLPALQMVEAAAALGQSVSYLAAGERVLPDVLDEDASGLVQSRMEAAGVRLVPGASVTQVLAEDGKAAGVKTADGVFYLADLVGACGEYRPATHMLPGGENGVRVAQDLSTPWPDIYAAGDVVGDEPAFNWLRAWRQGEQAGLAVCGVPTRPAVARSHVHLLNTELMGLGVVAIGQTVVPYRSGPTEVRSDVVGDVYKKLVFADDGRLIGALLVGNVAEAGALEEAIRLGATRADLDPALLKQLFEPTYQARFLSVHCPVCRHEIQLEPGAKPGLRLTCPVCGVEFVLVEERGRLGVRVAEG